MRHHVPYSLMSPYFLTNGISNDSGHDGPYEANTQDDDDLMTLGAMIGGEGLEALELSGFILLRGEGELFAVGGSRGSFGHGRLLFFGGYAGQPASGSIRYY
ncbi:MAG: hypothetical protein ABIE47_09045 [Pseudomonadota bacterium]